MENTTKNKTIVLLGGGTGGHIFPLISLYKEFQKVGFSAVFMGERGDSLEHRIAEKEGLPFIGIFSGKFRRYFSWRTLGVPVLLKLGGIQSFWYFLWHRPELVFSKGGYVSLPAAIAAWMLRIPVYLHESDAIPGLANRIVGKFSKKIFLGFAEAAAYFPAGRSEVVGQILSREVILAPYSGESIFPNTKTSEEKPKILVVCGSLGSSRVFEAVLSLPEALRESYNMVVTLGTLNTSFRERFEKVGIKTYDLLSQPQIMQAYREADIAITRAGATTLWELEIFNIRMLIIPLEGSANDHQNANAKAYTKKGSVIVEEKNLPESLEKTLEANTHYTKPQNQKISTLGAEKVFKSILG